MDSFFCLPEYISDSHLILHGEEHRHLARVMRKREGEEVFVTDGNGSMFQCRIDAIGDGETRCDIVRQLAEYNECPYPVTLIQGVLKNPGKMDWIVEKAVELGVTNILPAACEHSVGTGAKTERLRKLAIAATKQCLRSRVPKIRETASFEACLAGVSDQVALLFHEEEQSEHTLESLLSGRDLSGGVVLCIGPEGGFSDAERRHAAEAGAHSVSLGQRRLRSETAAIAAMARVSALT